nr:acetylornithine transaminase [Pseudomonadota bacterium]
MKTRARYDQVILPTYAPPAPVFVRGSGSQVWDEDNNNYIDFGGGIAVLSLGHCPPVLQHAINKQAATLMHLSNLHINAPAVHAAQLLTEHTFAERVFWCNSGAEANEAALKLARRYGVMQRASKSKVLSFENAFHGRIGLTMAATPQSKIREGFGPLAPGFYSSPYNDLAAAAAALDNDFCAIIVEPVQGEGGINIATDEFLHGLRALAKQHDALLLFDEIQSGAGRSGKLYAYMNSGVIPDILTSAKGLGGGFPVAAMLAAANIAEVLNVGNHGTTYGGNALATAAAAAVLETLLADGFLAGVEERAAEITRRLTDINNKHHCFSAIRNSGLLIGCDMVENGAENWSAKELA